MYFAVYQRILKNMNKDRTISRDKLFDLIFGRICHFPKRYRYVILKEMVNYGFLKDDGGERIDVLECDDWLDDSSEVFKNAKMF